jgi:DNA modification methylase
MKAPGIHPAQYSPNLVPVLADLLRRHGLPGTVLDPFGGLGNRFADICARAGYDRLYAVEIEPGYMDHAHPCVVLGDSTAIRRPDNYFGAAVTSPVYPNRMTDVFDAKDDSTRHTYVHRLRAHHGADYRLQANNAGGTKAGNSKSGRKQFYAINADVYREVHRVLKLGAPFIVNTKDTPHELFTAATTAQLVQAGFTIVECVSVPCAGLNHGAGHEGKVDHEDITVAVKA